MQAVVLAGGKGSRLAPYTTVLPKPLMPVGDQPILEIMLRQLKAAGFTHIILAVGYMHHLFESFFGDGERYGLKITYSFEEKALGTAGPLAQIMDQLDEHFLVTNGDLLTTLNWSNIMADHVQAKRAATIGMFHRQVSIDFGVVKTDGEGRLAEYIEKPTYEFDVSMGVNVFSRERIRPYLIAGDYLDIPDLMRNLSEKGEEVFCYKEPCEWLDIGRVDDYQAAAQELLENQGDYLK